MFIIRYTRTEFHGEPEECTAPLSVFLYDIPYFAPFYILPPLHIMNQSLQQGGGDGGMSPGCIWEPFTIDTQTYQSLLPLLLEPDLGVLQQKARYAMFAYGLDPEFDTIEDRFEWIGAVAKKHRDAFFIRQQAYIDEHKFK